MRLIGGNSKPIKKRRIQVTSATFERLSNVIGIGNINKDEVINRLIDSWRIQYSIKKFYIITKKQ